MSRLILHANLKAYFSILICFVLKFDNLSLGGKTAKILFNEIMK